MSRARSLWNLAIAVVLGTAIFTVGTVGAGFAYMAWKSGGVEKRMVCAIAEQWQCPVDSVSLQSAGPAVYRFQGCGRDATYYCKMPGDGCSLDNNMKDVLRPKECP